MTPHVSGITTDTFRDRVGDILRNLRALEEGSELINVVGRRTDGPAARTKKESR